MAIKRLRQWNKARWSDGMLVCEWARRKLASRKSLNEKRNNNGVEILFPCSRSLLYFPHHLLPRSSNEFHYFFSIRSPRWMCKRAVWLGCCFLLLVRRVPHFCRCVQNLLLMMKRNKNGDEIDVQSSVGFCAHSFGWSWDCVERS